MSVTTRKLRVDYPSGSECAIVNVTGDKRNQEPESVEIRFPWGYVGVTRAQDGKPLLETQYWVHVYVNHEMNGSYVKGETVCGQITDARLDQSDKHASETNVGDFDRAELYHLAVKVGARPTN